MPKSKEDILAEIQRVTQDYRTHSNIATYLLELNRIIIQRNISDKTIVADKSNSVASFNMGCGGLWVEKTATVKPSTSPRRRGATDSSTTFSERSEVERVALCSAVIQSLHDIGMSAVLIQEGPSISYLKTPLHKSVNITKLGIANNGESGQVRSFISLNKVTPSSSNSATAAALVQKATDLGLDKKEYQILETSQGQIYINVHFDWGRMYGNNPVPQGVENRLAFLQAASAAGIVSGDTNIESADYEKIKHYVASAHVQLNGGCNTLDILAGNGMGAVLATTAPLPPPDVYATQSALDEFEANMIKSAKKRVTIGGVQFFPPSPGTSSLQKDATSTTTQVVSQAKVDLSKDALIASTIKPLSVKEAQILEEQVAKIAAFINQKIEQYQSTGTDEQGLLANAGIILEFVQKGKEGVITGVRTLANYKAACIMSINTTPIAKEDTEQLLAMIGTLSGQPLATEIVSSLKEKNSKDKSLSKDETVASQTKVELSKKLQLNTDVTTALPKTKQLLVADYLKKLEFVTHLKEENSKDKSLSKDEKNVISEYCIYLEAHIKYGIEEIEKRPFAEAAQQMEFIQKGIDYSTNDMVAKTHKFPISEGFKGIINSICGFFGFSPPYTLSDSSVITKIQDVKERLQDITSTEDDSSPKLSM